MSKTKMVIDYCEDHDIDLSFDSYLAEVEGKKLDKAYKEYLRKQDALGALLNKGLDTSIDTSKKLYN